MSGFHCVRIAVIGVAVAMLTVIVGACQREDGKLSVEPLLSDGAVLQQNASILVGGKAAPGCLVTVSADWDFSMTATAGLDSLWSVILTTPEADLTRHRVVVETAKSSVCFSDILIGEVWLSIGQAENHAVDCDLLSGADVQTDSLVRFFVIESGASDVPCRFVRGRWATASTDNFHGIGQISLSFLSHLRDSLRIPVGVVIAQCSGAPANAWADVEAIPDDDMRADAEEKYDIWRESHLRCSDWLNSLPRMALKDVTSVYDEYMCVARPDIGLWPRIALPGKWGVSELPGLNGVVWLAKDVKLPTAWRGRRLRLLPGRIGGSGVAYANQIPIGEFDDSNVLSPTCIFDIPKSATVSSDNNLSLAFRVKGTADKGGFYGIADGSPMRIELLPSTSDESAYQRDSVLRIDGSWRYYAVALADADSLRLFGTPDNVFMASFRKSLAVPYDLCGSVSNKMLRPLAGKAVSGVLCNVGEEDGNPSSVSLFLPLIVRSVRSIFADKSLRFYFVQKGRAQAAGLSADGVREAQSAAVASMSRVRLVPTIDLSPVSASLADFDRQRLIGERLSALALSDAYGVEGLRSNWPMPLSASSHNQVMTVQFDNADGLYVNLDRPTAFEVAGADSVFYPARALAGDGSVTVFSHMVPDPVFVRYAHYDAMEPTLFNASGLSAPSFFFRASAADDCE